MKLARDLFSSWYTVNLTPTVGKPFGESWWPFNPSIHRCADGRWRCSVRVANYTLPDGEIVAPRGVPSSHVVILDLDSSSWECEGLSILNATSDCVDAMPRRGSTLGYEDVRLFTSNDGKTYAVACSLMHGRPGVPEQVLLSIDWKTCEITDATPMRGEWSFRAQKNWMPFDGYVPRAAPHLPVDPLRFLYGIDDAIVLTGLPRCLWSRSAVRGEGPLSRIEDRRDLVPASHRGGVEVKMAARPREAPRSAEVVRRKHAGSNGLRGGSQLVEIGVDRYLGIAHEVLLEGTRKFYWHTFFTCTEHGVMLERSEPLKLAEESIEFAAGLAFAGDDAIISFGTDDHEAHLGITTRADIERLLVPIEDWRDGSGARTSSRVLSASAQSDVESRQ